MQTDCLNLGMTHKDGLVGKSARLSVWMKP